MGCGYSRYYYQAPPPRPADTPVEFAIKLIFCVILFVVGMIGITRPEHLETLRSYLFDTRNDIDQKSVNPEGQNDVEEANEPVAAPAEKVQKRKNKQPKK